MTAATTPVVPLSPEDSAYNLSDGQKIGMVYDSAEAANDITPSKATLVAVKSVLKTGDESE